MRGYEWIHREMTYSLVVTRRREIYASSLLLIVAFALLGTGVPWLGCKSTEVISCLSLGTASVGWVLADDGGKDAGAVVQRRRILLVVQVEVGSAFLAESKKFVRLQSSPVRHCCTSGA